MVRQHHQLNGPEFGQTLGDREGQGSMVCCTLWGHRVGHDLATEQREQSDMTISFIVLMQNFQPQQHCHMNVGSF